MHLRVGVAIDVDDSDIEVVEEGAGAELTMGDKFFKPLYLLPIWKEPGNMTKRIAAAVLLPSGVESGGFSIAVSPGGMTLEITVEWLAPLVDLNMTHRKWLSKDSPEYLKCSTRNTLGSRMR